MEKKRNNAWSSLDVRWDALSCLSWSPFIGLPMVSYDKQLAINNEFPNNLCGKCFPTCHTFFHICVLEFVLRKVYKCVLIIQKVDLACIWGLVRHLTINLSRSQFWTADSDGHCVQWIWGSKWPNWTLYSSRNIWPNELAFQCSKRYVNWASVAQVMVFKVNTVRQCIWFWCPCDELLLDELGPVPAHWKTILQAA